MQTKKLQIIPLGGLGEFWINRLAIRWQDDIIVIDAGLMFPEVGAAGRRYRRARHHLPHREQAACARHHPYSRPRRPHRRPAMDFGASSRCQCMRPEFTLAYVEGKLESTSCGLKRPGRDIPPGKSSPLARLSSSPSASPTRWWIAWRWPLNTPAGVIIHTGDFKIDLAPLDGQVI